VHFFADPQVGVVQTRWSYLNRDSNVLTEIQAILLDGHFVLEHGARCGRGLFFNFNGTAGILRRSMIADAGGWQHDTLTEDSDLSYRAQLKGWKFVYLPALDCPRSCPSNAWLPGAAVPLGKGLTQVARKLLPSILRADIPGAPSWKRSCTSPPTSAIHDDGGLGADAPGHDLPLLHGWFQMVFLDMPLIIASFWSIRRSTCSRNASFIRTPGSARSSCCPP